MRFRYWILVVAIAVPLVIAAIPVMVFGYDEIARDDQVARNVYVEGVSLGGLTEEEARDAISDLEARLVAAPAEFTVDGTTVVLMPAEVGLAVDADAVVGKAFEQRQTGSVFSDFTAWLGGWHSEIHLGVPVIVAADALEDVLTSWDREVIDEPAYEGAVLISSGRAEPEYPRAGLRIDRDIALDRVTGSVAVVERPTPELPLTDLEPLLTAADIDVAVETANELIDTPVVLVDEMTGLRTVLRKQQLAAAVSSELMVNSPARLAVQFDDEVLLAELDSVL
jgi:hypothetical protein